MEDNSAYVIEKDSDEEALRAFLDRFDTPNGLAEVVPLLDAASRLVETAAYGAAGSVDKSVVVDLILMAAQLEAKAMKIRGFEVS